MSGMRRREFITFLGGAAAAWPLAARAQQSPAMPVIGFLSSRSPEDSAHLIEAFRRGLSEGGFVAGQNVAIEFRWAHGQFDLLPAMASELVGRRVSVFVAVGGEPSALAAKRANGNLTGITLQTLFMEPKRLGLLRDLVPRALLSGVLLNSSFALAASQRQEIEEAARGIGQRIVIVDASTDGELDAAFAELAKQRADALLVAASPYFDTRRDHIVLLAQRHRLPAIYQFREFAMAGGLLSYGIAITEGYRQVGIYSANILRGAKPADLPVQAISKFELLINLKTAKALDIKISDNLLSLADEVI